MAFPTQAQPLAPGAMGHVPTVAYDMNRFGDAFSNGMPNPNSREGKSAKRRLKEMAREDAREEKEQRKAMEKAAKKQQEWERGGRREAEILLQAEDEEYRRRERDRHDSDPYTRNHGIGGRAPGFPYPGMARPPTMNIGGGLADRDRDQDRGRKISMMGRSHSRNASATDVTYGGAGYGSSYNGVVPGGGEFNEPGYPGGGAYPRESKPNHMNGPKYGSGLDRESHYGGPARAGAATPYGGSNRSRSSTYGPGSAGLGVGGPPYPIGGSGIPAGPGIPAPGIPGSSMPGNGRPGSGRPGSGIPGGGMPGNGMPGRGMAGNGIPGNGMPGGMPGGGMPKGGMPGGGMPKGGMPGSGMPGGGMPGGGVMPGRLGSNVPGYSGPACCAAYSQPLAFEREPNRNLAYQPFDPFVIVMDMDELIEFPEIPPLPAALLPHDVLHNDWARYMSSYRSHLWVKDVAAAWKQSRSQDPHDRVANVRPVLSKWNHQFFTPRGVQFHVSKASKPRHRRSRSRGSHGRYDSDDDSPSESDTEDSDLGEDEYGAGYHEDPRYRQSARNKSRRHRNKGSNQIYHLTVEYVPQHGGASIRKSAVGGYQGGFP
ncbi:hypothetical protein BS47DRAFT_1351908 [Hydnum rufescens UP504]|uniref:Uncharacterized protein n=1 Tax=Hydnum rufescens UP504 TaxID=1448309 RepID=A0A9P6DQB0_9AGAM|nr:hypothetical protein BS47DRAFT_1351908 [Hydnum rufescens UP504]